MSKLQMLLDRYAGTRSAAPVARGVRVAYNMECGCAGNFGKDCSDPRDCDCDCVYDDDDNY